MGVDQGNTAEQVALITLLRARPSGLKWPDITTLVLEAGSALEVRKDLIGDDLLPSAETIQAGEDLVGWTEGGTRFITILDENYPERLRGIQEAPPFLFLRGRSIPEDIGVSVVGSRDASNKGLQMAAAIAKTLVSMDVTVVSGLAAGIDAAAHTACLDAGGRPVAVIGTGINLQYPAANRELHSRVADAGLLMSQFWPDAPPQKHSFPMRNATMSGYGIATIVVEAGEHSGARIQARLAVQHGRPVVLTDSVVIRNDWAKAMIDRPGVHQVSSIDEVRSIVTALVDEPNQFSGTLDNLLSA